MTLLFHETGSTLVIVVTLQEFFNEMRQGSSSFGTSKHPAADPVEDENNGDDDSSELEDGNLVSLLCHTCQSSSTALQAV